LSIWKIPLSDIDYGCEEVEAVDRVLRSKWLSMGPEVEAFEAELAAMQGAKHAIAVSSATAALHLSLLAAGIGPGDEVIQPALNFVASANMTVACGARPVFADIVSLYEPTIDPAKVAQLITPNTRAVIVMHYGGNLCRMDGLQALCSENKLFLIEDACHAVGARSRSLGGEVADGKMAGSIGDIGCFSFFANKNLTAGEGGMVVTDSDDLANKVRLLRSHGMTSLTWQRHLGHARSYDVIANGYNYRLDELHAALGRVQLAKLERNNERRRKLLLCYRRVINELDGWTMPFSESIEHSAAHLMVAVAPTTEARDQAVERVRTVGIQSSLHYPCIADFEAFARFSSKTLFLTRDFVSRAITLPLYPGMAHKDPENICAAVGASASVAATL
jgi:dTDP-4-amino-4,6-dideoxygalactose transaminase